MKLSEQTVCLYIMRVVLCVHTEVQVCLYCVRVRGFVSIQHERETGFVFLYRQKVRQVLCVSTA